MNEPNEVMRTEPRWPVALAICVVVLLLALLPGRISLIPTWMPYVVGAILLAPMAAVRLSGGKPRWLRVERVILRLFAALVAMGIVANLMNLVRAVVGGSGGVGGLPLLASSIAVWVNNVLAFSLLYWQIDRGGPEHRINRRGVRPDWLFPQSGAGEDAPPDWAPRFVDYLFLGFSTATAFSPTDALPMTTRAKLLMMLQSTISLATLALVAARAINILGS